MTRQLRLEPRPRMRDLVGARVAVARRARLEDVRDEDVLAREPGLREQRRRGTCPPRRRTAGPSRSSLAPGASPTSTRSARPGRPRRARRSSHVSHGSKPHGRWSRISSAIASRRCPARHARNISQYARATIRRVYVGRLGRQRVAREPARLRDLGLVDLDRRGVAVASAAKQCAHVAPARAAQQDRPERDRPLRPQPTSSSISRSTASCGSSPSLMKPPGRSHSARRP